MSERTIKHFGGNKKLVNELVSTGLWIRRGDGDLEYRDWLKYQPCKEKVLSDRAEGAERKLAYRHKSQPNVPTAPRSDSAGCPPVASAGVTEAPRIGLASASLSPDPDPDPGSLLLLKEDLTLSSPNTIVGVNADMWHVFHHWATVWGKKLPATKFTDGRKAAVKARLKTYPLSDLIDAVDGARLSPHYLGQNDSGQVYDDLRTILLNDDRLEQHRDRKRRGGNQPVRLNGSNITPAARAAAPEDYEADNHNGWPAS